MSHARGNALSSARTWVAGAWVAVVVAAALAIDHPLVLLALGVSLVGVSLTAGHGTALLRAAIFSAPLLLGVVVINALLSRDGLTVVARLGAVPFLGRIDVTAEALAYGGVLALRAFVVVLAVALFAVCVDQDEVVALVRRRSGRFGLGAALAVRMVPLLVADGRRMAEARNAVPAASAPSRTAVLTALAGGALDRAGDAAATLEMRGLGDGPCLAPIDRRPWSRHDRAMLLSALAIAATLCWASLEGWLAASFRPWVDVPGGAGAVIVVVIVPLLAILPTLDRRGVSA